MNNTFNINRFCNLLAYDGRKYLRNFGLTFAILCGLNLVLWLLTLIFGFTMPTLPRWGIIYLAIILGVIMVPAKAFGDINLSREGVRFAMLPVSNLEKYLSYSLFCLLTPVFLLLASWGVDSLLTLLPFGGFTHYIRSFGFGNIMNDFIVEMSDIAQEDLSEAEGFDTILDMFSHGYSFAFIIGIIFNVGVFMLGNLLFKTHKTAKTLVCLIGISYVVSMIMQVFFISIDKSIFVNPENVDLSFISSFTQSMISASNILYAILTIGLYIGIFFKLKTQKY